MASLPGIILDLTPNTPTLGQEIKYRLRFGGTMELLLVNKFIWTKPRRMMIFEKTAIPSYDEADEIAKGSNMALMTCDLDSGYQKSKPAHRTIFSNAPSSPFNNYSTDRLSWLPQSITMRLASCLNRFQILILPLAIPLVTPCTGYISSELYNHRPTSRQKSQTPTTTTIGTGER